MSICPAQLTRLAGYAHVEVGPGSKMEEGRLQEDLGAIIRCMTLLQVRSWFGWCGVDQSMNLRGSGLGGIVGASCTVNSSPHTFTHTQRMARTRGEQKADLEGVNREEMYAPPEHAAPATPLRDDVVTEGALRLGFVLACAWVCGCVWVGVCVGIADGFVHPPLSH